MLRVGFFCSSRERCLNFAQTFAQGVRANGDISLIRAVLRPQGEGDIVGPIATDIDVAVLNSIMSKHVFATMQAAGIPIIYIDKAYNRDWNYRRVSINAVQPTEYLGKLGCPEDRCRAFNWSPAPWRSRGNHVLLAWASPRNHEWRGWAPPEDHAQDIVEVLRHFTKRPIVYRAKPNQEITHSLKYAHMSEPGTTLEHNLRNCHALITPGTSTCLTALLKGIPTIVLDDALTKNISSTVLAEVEHPKLASEQERIALLNDLAYCQWSLEEFVMGDAWYSLRRQLYTILDEPWRLK